MDSSGETWRHKFAYDYSVDGETYISSRKKFGIGSKSQTNETDSPAHKESRKYLVNSTIDLCYDPKKPSRSTLITGTSPALVKALATFVILYPLGIFSSISLFN